MLFEYGVPYTLESPGGDIDFNVDLGGGGRYRIIDVELDVDIRGDMDPLSQRDGGVIHPKFLDPARVIVTGEIEDDGSLTLRRTLLEALKKSVLYTARANGRLLWTPSGYGDDRMMDRIRLGYWRPIKSKSPDAAVTKVFEFGLDCPDPLSYDATEIVTHITASGTVPNAGNAPSWPVIKVNGPTTGFTVTNADLGEAIVVDGSGFGFSVASGHYVEIDTKREVVTLDGDVLFYGSEVDWTASVFGAVSPGGDTYTLSGAPSMDVLSNNAWW